jgi:hypothetical protein
LRQPIYFPREPDVAWPCLLMVVYEYRKMPQPLGSANVVGVRWAATF